MHACLYPPCCYARHVQVRQLSTQANVAYTSDLSRRQGLASTQRTTETMTRARNAEAAYRPFEGGSTNMHARLLALGQGKELE